MQDYHKVLTQKEIKEFEKEYAPKMPMGDLANDPIKTFN